MEDQPPRVELPVPEPGLVLVRWGLRRAYMRRVIAVRGGAVAYSTGGNRNGLCKLKNWHRWAKQAKPAL